MKIVWIVLLSLGLNPANAALPTCNSAIEGMFRFDAGTYFYCNGTAWVSMSNGIVPTASICTAGTIKFDVTADSFVYCTGSGWQSVKGEVATGCVGNQRMSFDSVSKKYRFSDSSASCFWVGPISTFVGTCVSSTVGSVCQKADGASNGSVLYAGEYSGTKYMATPLGCDINNNTDPACTYPNAPMKFSTAGTAGVSVSFSDGATNTANIVSTFNGDSSTTYATGNAGKYCDALVYDGYNDWFLPARDELVALVKNSHSTNQPDPLGFGTQNLSTSTQLASSTNYWRVIGETTSPYNPNTTSTTTFSTTSAVRCVRKF